MNRPQQAMMAILQETERPEVEHAQTWLGSAKALDLPPRVTGAIEHYIRLQTRAARLKTEAGEASKDAGAAWQSVRDHAKTIDDLVDQAMQASSTKTTTTTEREPDPPAIVPEQAEDDLADRIEGLLTNSWPRAKDYYCNNRTLDGHRDYLRQVIAKSNDPEVISLLIILHGAVDIFLHKLVEPSVAPVVLAPLEELLARIEQDPSQGDPCRAALQAIKLRLGSSALEFLRTLSPALVDVLQGNVAFASVDLELLKTARRVVLLMEPNYMTGASLSNLSAHIGERAARLAVEEKKAAEASPEATPAPEPAKAEDGKKKGKGGKKPAAPSVLSTVEANYGKLVQVRVTGGEGSFIGQVVPADGPNVVLAYVVPMAVEGDHPINPKASRPLSLALAEVENVTPWLHPIARLEGRMNRGANPYVKAEPAKAPLARIDGEAWLQWELGRREYLGCFEDGSTARKFGEPLDKNPWADGDPIDEGGWLKIAWKAGWEEQEEVGEPGQ